jgi:hypothetical protein
MACLEVGEECVGPMAQEISRGMATRLLPVSRGCGVLVGLPAKLWLVVQCFGQVMIRGRLKWVGPGHRVT